MLSSGWPGRCAWTTASRSMPAASRSVKLAALGPSIGGPRRLPRPQRPPQPGEEQQQQQQQPAGGSGMGPSTVPSPYPDEPRQAPAAPWQHQQQHQQQQLGQQQAVRPQGGPAPGGPPPPRRPRQQKRRMEPHPWEVVIVGPHNAADRSARYLIGLLRHAETQHAQRLAQRDARRTAAAAVAARSGSSGGGILDGSGEDEDEEEEGEEEEERETAATSKQPTGSSMRRAPPRRRGMRGPPRVVLLASVRAAHPRMATLLMTATSLLERGHGRTLLFQPLADVDDPSTMHVFTWLASLNGMQAAAAAAGEVTGDAASSTGVAGQEEGQEEGELSGKVEQQQQQAAGGHPLRDLPTRKDLICSSNADPERLGRAIAAEVTSTGAARVVSAGGPSCGNALAALSHARHALLQSSRACQDLVVYVSKRYGGASPAMGPTGPSGAIVYDFVCVACLGPKANQPPKQPGGERGKSSGS